MEHKTISAEEFIKLLSNGKALNIIDVRNADEHAKKHLSAPHKNIPLDTLNPKELGDEEQTIYLLCGGGTRAGRAAALLAQNGFENATVVTGGMRSCAVNGADCTGTEAKSEITCKSKIA